MTSMTVRRLAIVLSLAALAGCGKKPDMPTACANRVADMFGVRRDNVGLADPRALPDGGWVIGGAVDTERGTEGARAFGCYFDARGKLDVKVEVSDAE